MTRRAIVFATMLLLVSGCGDSTPATLTGQGLKQLRAGKYDEAIATCGKAIRQNPQDAEAYLYRGRAYQFRNAMGDPPRAIADFSEAIRLAPDSSDAYYSRAIVYRDLGQAKLADADDKKARAADGLLQEVYRRLPEPPAPATVAEALPDVPTDEPSVLAPQTSGVVLPKSEFEQRELFEKLKERFEPAQPDAEARENPIERFNRLSRQPPPEKPAAAALGPLGKLGSQAPLAPQTGQSPPSMSEDPNALVRPPQRSAPSSPFQPRLPDGLSGDFNQPPQSPQSQQTYRPVQSPFGQSAPSTTGIGVQPANPFGPQAPRTVGQQPAPSNDVRFSNPAVRPDNPRDYVP
jgi:TPR repeat/Tetratricopeptide repeat